MKKIIAAGILALGSWAGAAQAVTTVTFNGASGTIPTGMYVFQNFNALAANSSIGTNAVVLASTTADGARPAYGSTGNFAVVKTGGTYSVSFDATNAFSFVLGSLDTYNTLLLRYADGSTGLYQGGQIINDMTFPSGNQISGETNGVVTYTVTSGPRLTGATFTSSDQSFEFDNLATAVPEPAAWGMMIFGFGLVGGAMRRRSKVSTKVQFA